MFGRHTVIYRSIFSYKFNLTYGADSYQLTYILNPQRYARYPWSTRSVEFMGLLHGNINFDIHHYTHMYVATLFRKSPLRPAWPLPIVMWYIYVHNGAEDPYITQITCQTLLFHRGVWPPMIAYYTHGPKLRRYNNARPQSPGVKWPILHKRASAWYSGPQRTCMCICSTP